jgi:hypothetical protein
MLDRGGGPREKKEENKEITKNCNKWRGRGGVRRWKKWGCAYVFYVSVYVSE